VELFAKALEIGEREHAFHFDVIGLIEVVPVLEELRGEVAVVGEEDEAGSGVFEIADGVNAFGKTAEKIAEGFASFGIGERGDNFGRFVEEEIDVPRGRVGDGAACSFDFVGGGIGFGAKFSDGFAIDAHLAGKDELFGMASRSDAGTGDNFLEAFEHCFGAIKNSRYSEVGSGKRKRRTKRKSEEREIVAFGRKSPPFVKGAKDGAPSRSFVRWCAGEKDTSGSWKTRRGDRRGIPRFEDFARNDGCC
jgi:hypothetical protein